MPDQQEDSRFAKFTVSCVWATGTPAALLAAFAVAPIGGALGWLFNFSDAYQLFANLFLSVVTFWLAMLIQAGQNQLQLQQARDTKAIQAKLDELIHATQGARDALIRVEEADEQEIDAKRRECIEAKNGN